MLNITNNFCLEQEGENLFHKIDSPPSELRFRYLSYQCTKVQEI